MVRFLSHHLLSNAQPTWLSSEGCRESLQGSRKQLMPAAGCRKAPLPSQLNVKCQGINLLGRMFLSYCSAVDLQFCATQTPFFREGQIHVCELAHTGLVLKFCPKTDIYICCGLHIDCRKSKKSVFQRYPHLYSRCAPLSSPASKD